MIGFEWGVAGAAWATVTAQAAAGLRIMVYTVIYMSHILPERKHRKISRKLLRYIAGYSVLTCVQQSVMNFGILMIQGLVNNFGTVIMAAFAAAVKIDTLVYMPAQELEMLFLSLRHRIMGLEKKSGFIRESKKP